jgi:transcription antitermination factor NusG
MGPDFPQRRGGAPMFLSRESYSWFAVQVRTLHESPIAVLLRAKGYEPFHPTCKCRRQWSDRIKLVDQPLFPGYLFCQFDVQKRLAILTTPGVIRVVGCGKSPLPVADSEIQALQAMVRSGLPTQSWAFLNIGDRVRVNHGALRGVEGILTQVKSRHRIILSITLLQRSVAVEIDSVQVSLLQRTLQTSTVGSSAARNSYVGDGFTVRAPREGFRAPTTSAHKVSPGLN